jgi:hypothetical protein
MSNLAIRVILLGAALCLAIPFFLRLQYLNQLRRRSTLADGPHSAKPILVRAKAVPPLRMQSGPQSEKLSRRCQAV